MYRYPPIKPSDLDSEQKSLHEACLKNIGNHFQVKFTTKDENDALVGPFPVLLRTPALGHAFLQMGYEGNKLLGVSSAVRETAIVATGSTFKAAYELYAHCIIASQGTDLTEKQVSLIREGIKPDGEDKLDAACDVAFDMAIELTAKPGPLSKETWNRARETVGEESTLGLIHLIAFYSYTCVVLNGGGVPAPE